MDEEAEPQPEPVQQQEPMIQPEQKQEFYPKKLEKNLILRDELAIERTRLSEERTQLSYIRTGISILYIGLFFVGFFEAGTTFAYLGYATIVIGLLFLAYGFYHHKKSKRLINQIIDTLKDADKVDNSFFD
jgi:putative membrane protein